MKYSSEVDVLVIELPGRVPVESEHFEKHRIIVDYDENNEIVGLEILDWSKRQQVEIPIVGKFFAAKS